MSSKHHQIFCQNTPELGSIAGVALISGAVFLVLFPDGEPPANANLIGTALSCGIVGG
jgi:hypothetical protein